MNKFSAIGIPLPVTSAILIYNLGFVSSVEAQENSLFNNIKFDGIGNYPPQLYLHNNKLNLFRFNSSLLSLDKSVASTKIFDSRITLPSPGNNSLNLTSSLIPEIPPESIFVSLIIESASDIQPQLLATSDHLNQDNSNNITPQIINNELPSVDLDDFKVKADKSTIIPNSLNSSATPIINNSINQTLTEIAKYQLPNLAFESLTQVKELKDVQPTDWAYKSLIRLIAKYDCFSGFEDQTFQGNRNLTRYEFAAALNSCLHSIETIATNNQSTATEFTELSELARLKTEFKTELLTVQTSIDDLEQQVTFIEDHNFSPTTILRGQVDFIVASAFGDLKAVSSGETPTEDLEDEATFSSRVRLNFETSFTGKDLLRTRLEAGNINAFGSGATGTQMTFLGDSTNTNNSIRIGQMFYRFPLGEKGNAYIAGARQSASAFIPTLNRASTISLFGFNNPLYDLGFGAGGGVYYQFNDLIGAGLTYYSGSPSSPEENKGFFNGDYSALGQVTFTPSDGLGISFTYAHFFSPQPGSTNNVTSFTGSQFAQLPFGENTATASDNFNLAFSYQIGDRLELGGWLGYINADAKSSPANSGFLDLSDANADIWTGAITASYNDLGKLGSKLSFILGVPPKLTSNDLSNRQDNDTSLHLELSYSYPLTERISLKPGVLAITNPEHNSENDSIAIGNLQTTFSF